jgi:hypothetical protein
MAEDGRTARARRRRKKARAESFGVFIVVLRGGRKEPCALLS